MLHVAYNDAFGILRKISRWTSASDMFVNYNVPTFDAVLRNFLHIFMCGLIKKKKNAIIIAIDVSMCFNFSLQLQNHKQNHYNRGSQWFVISPYCCLHVLPLFIFIPTYFYL